MKRKSYVLLCNLVCGALLLTGCVGSDDSGDMMELEDVTYTTNIRPIIENNCVQCHSDPTQNGAPMPLDTYDALRAAVETRPLLDRINSISSPMPPTGLLPDAPRNLIQEWVDQGFPEN